MRDIYQVLDELNIAYEKYEHPAVFTVEEAEKYDRGIDSAKSKNLFLRNKKGDQHYLVVAQSTIKVDIKKLEELTGEKNLSFASPERLLKFLGVTPGSVSPFTLVNNTDKSVKVLIDKGLLDHNKQAFHPNTNTATLVISTEDFIKFLDWTGNKVTYLSLQ